MRYEYKTENTCPQIVYFGIDGNIITNIEFYGGCNGNPQASSNCLRVLRLKKSKKNCLATPAADDRHLVPTNWQGRSEQNMKKQRTTNDGGII